MNKLQILGTITSDIELIYTQGGSAIANFGIAYNDKWKGQDGQVQEKAHFFRVSAFGKTAENINSFFFKGSRILIDGSLDFQEWVDNTTNEKKSKVAIKLNGFSFIDRKSDNNQQGQQQQYGNQNQQKQNNQNNQQQQNGYQENQQQQNQGNAQYGNQQQQSNQAPQQQQNQQNNQQQQNSGYNNSSQNR